MSTMIAYSHEIAMYVLNCMYNEHMINEQDYDVMYVLLMNI